MPVVNPPSGHHKVAYLGDSLEIAIPSRKQWFQTVFVAFWLIGWTFGEVFVGSILLSGIVGLLSGKSPKPTGGEAIFGAGGGLFMLAWFCLWTVGGAFVWHVFLWQMAGKEVVRISHRSMLIGRQILGIRRTKEYLAEYIRDLRVSPADYSSFGWSRSARAWGLSGGLTAFDYGAKTLRFGSGVDEAEAKQILATIQEHFPQYKSAQ